MPAPSCAQSARVRAASLVLLSGALVLAGCMTGADDASRPRTGGADAAGRDARFAELAEASQARGQYGAAARFYREAAKRRPDAAGPQLGLGRALLALGKPRAAVDAFRDALKADGRANKARLGLGRALTAADQPAKAVEVLAPLVADADAGHAARLARGVALDLQGKHAEAQASYRAGLADAPGSLPLRNNLGLSKVLAGDVESGIAILKEAAGRRDATARTRQNLALAHGLAGNMDKAARIARQDLERTGVERNLAYYETLHALWHGDPEGGGAKAARELFQPARADAGDEAAPKPAGDSGARTATADAAPPKPAAKPKRARQADPKLARRADGEPIQLAAAVEAPGDGGLRVRVGKAEAGDNPAGSGRTTHADGLAPRIRAAERSLVDASANDAGEAAQSHWIQLASLATEALAAEAQKRIAARFPKLADALPMALHPAELGRTKRVHRVQAGPFAGAGAASALCRALRARGQGCLVVRR